MNLLHCDLASNAGEHLSILPNLRISYKEQLIFSNSLSALGCEILIDFDSIQYASDFLSKFSNSDLKTSIIKYDSMLSGVLNYCLENIERYILSSFRYIFINMEVSSLCNVSSLSLISYVQQKLFLHGIELVVEITERNNCKSCTRVFDGINYLVSNGIILAADDFDYIGSDFRLRGLKSLMYTFVKLEFPQNKSDEDKFFNMIKFCNDLGVNVIIERIEDVLTIENPLFKNIWGLQGFAFCKGIKFK